MAADVARISFDAGRRYTGTVSQQGRVALEAEENEHRRILAEERRRELLEIVGPAGTPDDGYAVTAIAAGHDIAIGTGTMYVGGQRVSLDHPVRYGWQEEWLDARGHPAFVPPEAVNPRRNEHVLLVVTEREVTATEDPVLREVALGGPDGAARTRLVQRIERHATDAQTCADALADDRKTWHTQGLTFDPATMELSSDTRLAVAWQASQATPDPCRPASAGGYLGAENQVIRVQVAHVYPGGDRFDLLWGYDNASMLYRVTAGNQANPVLTLSRSPVDEHHWPQAGQAVEVLRSAAELRSSDGTTEGLVASPHGVAAVLTAPYDPDDKTIEFPAALPAVYTNKVATPQLFLRVWEELLVARSVDTDLILTGTGLTVRLSIPPGGAVHVGDHWSVAVRPSTPQEVLPARYARAPQPPDGPRTWVCPLAVIGWLDEGRLDLFEDCRRHFRPLVDIDPDGCCTISVGPADVRHHRLQRLIDAATVLRDQRDRAQRVTVCFRPGRYELERPLTLTHLHSNLHLEGCDERVVLAARRGLEDRFPQGLIVLVHADNVRISGLELELPLVPATVLKPVMFTAEVRKAFEGLWVSVGIRPVHAAMLEVERCVFRFRVPPGKRPAENLPYPHVFAVAIFAGAECWGLRLERNRFLRDPILWAQEQGRAQHLLIGYLLAPSTIRTFIDIRPVIRRLWALLDDAVIRDNVFSGITAACAFDGETGDLRFQDNVVRDCYGGLWVLFGADRPAGVPIDPFRADGRDALRAAGPAIPMFDAVVNMITLLAEAYPIPDEFLPEARRMVRQPAAGERPGSDGALPGFLRLRCTGNEIHCRVRRKEDEAASGLALLVWIGDREARGSAVVSDNRMTATAPIVALTWWVFEVVTTGNSVRNRSGRGYSYIIIGADAVAITGNVLSGPHDFPAGRPWPAPLDGWMPLNTRAL